MKKRITDMGGEGMDAKIAGIYFLDNSAEAIDDIV